MIIRYTGDNTSTSTHPQAKVPIEQYYAEKGVDYRRLRKNCRLRVNGEDATSSRGGNLYVDSFKPPEGYTGTHICLKKIFLV